MAPEHDRGQRVRYRFSPLERRGVIAGWRGGQIASVTCGLLADVVVLRARPSAGGVLIALVGLAAGLAVAFWPIRGRTGEQWLPLVVRWLWSGWTGSHRQLAQSPARGHQATVDTSRRGPASTEVRPVNGGIPHPRSDGIRWADGGGDAVRVPEPDGGARHGPRLQGAHSHGRACRAWPQFRPPQFFRPGGAHSRVGQGAVVDGAAKVPRSTGSSGSSPVCRTTAAPSAGTWPTMLCWVGTHRRFVPTGHWWTKPLR